MGGAVASVVPAGAKRKRPDVQIARLATNPAGPLHRFDAAPLALADFSNFADNRANEQRAIGALGDALANTQKLLIVTSGVGMVSTRGRPATENDAPPSEGGFPRTPERSADAVTQRGVGVAIVRLPQVDDTRRAGLVSLVIEVARQKGFVGYVSDGSNHGSAAHVNDVARLYRLALEKNATARYHAVGEEGVQLRAIAAPSLSVRVA